MNFLENLPDDQLAILGCVLALVFFTAILVVIPGLRDRARMTKSRTETRPRYVPRSKRVPTH
jgi:hypothetical protein